MAHKSKKSVANGTSLQKSQKIQHASNTGGDGMHCFVTKCYEK